MAFWVATPQDIGFIAYAQDSPRCLCPYEPGTLEEKGWLEGWDKAEERARHVEVAQLIFPDTPGTCEGCGTTRYTLRELNLYPDQLNQCYACTSRKRGVPEIFL